MTGNLNKKRVSTPKQLAPLRHQSIDLASIRGNVDFAIIAIKIEEYQAVIEKRLKITNIVQGSRRYGVGWLRVGSGFGYRVACVRCIEQGQTEAQQVANDIIDDLDPKWLILIGICGAMPANEFTLGDVIIASRVHDFSVQGVSQGGNVEFDTRGIALHKSARDVIEQLPAIGTQLGDWSSSKSIRVSRPDFDVPQRLSNKKLYGSIDWKKSVIESLRRHFIRKSRMEPIWWTAPIASGNTVLKDADLAAKLHSGIRNMAGIEMELAGVMRAADRREQQYPVLGIRGVSDIVGLRRDHDWTVYACHTASAFALALIKSGELLPPNKELQLPVIYNEYDGDSSVELRTSVYRTKPHHGQLQELVQKQKRQIENLPLLRHVVARESYAFLFPEVFVDPRLKLRKKPISQEIRLTEWISREFRQNITIAIIGPSGVGKTTSLIRTYLEFSDNFLSSSSDIVPVFVELRLLRGLPSYDRHSIIKAVASSIGIDLRSLPRRYGGTFLFFLDGLDEYLAVASEEERLQIASWPVLREWHVLGSRDEAYFQILGNSELETLYTEVLELQGWELDREVRMFVEAYYRKTVTEWRLEAKHFEDFLQENDLSTIGNTPLAITMLILIWRYEQGPRTLVIRNRSDLYQRFFEDWTSLEVEREGSKIKNKTILMHAIKQAAWHMYHWQRDPSNETTVLDLVDLSGKVGAVVGVNPRLLRQSRSFLSLLDVRDGFRRSEQGLVRAFRHESLQAFLVAEILIEAILHDNPNLEQALQTVYTYEVNTFVRERLSSEEMARPILENRLVEIYLRNIQQSDSETEEKITIRNGAAYYLGRLESERLRYLYDMVRSGEITEHPHVKGTMASGLILMNDEKSEVDYLENLKDDHPDDVRTRKFHLVYYGDAQNHGPASYLIDVPKRGQDDWKRTRAALLRRIASHTNRDLRLRAYDLRVFRRLCETRKYQAFTQEERAAITLARQGIEILPEYKQKLIEQEINRLMDLLSKSY